MRCSACDFENPDGLRFCGGCGTPLAAGCPSCGFVSPPGFRFCGECGAALARAEAPAPPAFVARIAPDPRAYTPKHLAEKILASKSALEGERKQVTVLFADVKGSMELAEAVDAEEWHRILDRFFQILAEGIHRYEGTVNQYTGDGIMALFGAPIAHEDHAQRACWAALHLQDALRRFTDELRLSRGLNLSVRMGLNSGEVVVGKIGDDLRMDYTAQGQTVGLAARVEQLAEAGRIYLAEHTARLVAGYFRLRDLGVLTVKGVPSPVRVQELEGVGVLRTRLDVSRVRGFSRFVGRADELATLEAALGRATSGQGQVVGVVADAGTGKSRLCFELAERCRARSIPVYESHAVAHGKFLPLLPILELWRHYFGIAEREGPQAARDKIAGRMVLLDPELTDALPLMFDFLGVPDPERPAPRMEPEARQRQLADLLRRLARARSRREPAVLLIEDLHWIDAASEQFLENIVDAVSGARTLLLVSFRPEYHASWMQKSWYQQLPLLPLGEEATSELLLDLLGPEPALAPLAALVRERTAGNPFFIEEVVQSLFDQGTLVRTGAAPVLARPRDGIEIPSTVQAVLAARIDRLAEREKRVLQTAAVVGKTFTESILGRVLGAAGEAPLPADELGAALHALRQGEFLYEQALYPEVEYEFKHPLTQEVALGAQLGTRRARVHAAVARALEDLAGERPGERAALLAHHWDAAGDAAQAARWHRRAAEWAGANNNAEALRHWQRARALLDTLPRSRETLAEGAAVRGQLLVQAYRAGLSTDEVATLLREARELAEASGDARTLAFVVSAAGMYVLFSGAPLEAAALFEEAIACDVEDADVGLRAWTRSTQSVGYLMLGRLAESLARNDEELALGRRDPEAGLDLAGFRPYLGGLSFRGWTLCSLGRLTEAAHALEQAVALAEQYGDLTPCGIAHSSLARLCDLTGDVRAAVAHGRAAVELAEKTGSQMLGVWAFGALGLAHVLDGQWHPALDSLGQALTSARERRAGLLMEAQLLAHLARAQLGQGDAAAARVTAEEAVAVARRRGTRAFEVEAHIVLARALIQVGAPRDQVQAALDAAASLVEETGAKGLLPFVHVVRAALARASGDQVAREHELRAAHRLFTEMEAPIRAAQLARELAA